MDKSQRRRRTSSLSKAQIKRTEQIFCCDIRTTNRILASNTDNNRTNTIFLCDIQTTNRMLAFFAFFDVMAQPFRTVVRCFFLGLKPIQRHFDSFAIARAKLAR